MAAPKAYNAQNAKPYATTHLRTTRIVQRCAEAATNNLV